MKSLTLEPFELREIELSAASTLLNVCQLLRSECTTAVTERGPPRLGCCSKSPTSRVP